MLRFSLARFLISYYFLFWLARGAVDFVVVTGKVAKDGPGELRGVIKMRVGRN